MDEVLVLTIVKSFINNMYILLINFKLLNKKCEVKNTVGIMFISFTISILYSLLQSKIDGMLMIIIMYFIQLAFLKIMIKDMKSSLIITNLIANSIVYVVFVLATFIEFLFSFSFKIKNRILNLILILILETIILIVFFKVKRFRHGFKFLQNKVNYGFIDIIMINISAVLILAYYLYGNYYGNLTKQLSICIVLLGIIMLIMIQKTITLYYKQKLLAKTIDDYKSEIENKDEQIKKLSEEKFKISKLNHEFYNRQEALELKVKEFLNNANLEIGEEISVINQIDKLSNEYSSSLKDIKRLEKLPSTEIEEIDDMFKYMQSECKKNDINFTLRVTGDIHHLVNKIIPKNKLVTLIGDHIRDAIIAVNFSNNKFKSILAIIGIKNGCYELCIYDSGIEFEIETLERLGLEPTTTHKENGGTGIGFMTTFETLKETNASLIIYERHKMSAEDYTKAVIIRFDGKNEYKICSYRADKIKKEVKDNRIIIEEL